VDGAQYERTFFRNKDDSLSIEITISACSQNLWSSSLGTSASCLFTKPCRCGGLGAHPAKQASSPAEEESSAVSKSCTVFSTDNNASFVKKAC